MRPSIMRQVSCRLTGVVLTCYVDGQKVFRPLRMESISPFEALHPRASEVMHRPGGTSNPGLPGR